MDLDFFFQEMQMFTHSKLPGAPEKHFELIPFSLNFQESTECVRACGNSKPNLWT